MLSQEQLAEIKLLLSRCSVSETVPVEESVANYSAIMNNATSWLRQLLESVRAKDTEIEMHSSTATYYRDQFLSIQASEEQAKSKLAIAVEALEWYAERNNHEIIRRFGGDYAPITLDKGERARQSIDRINSKEV